MSRLTPARRAVAEVLHGHARRPGRLDQQLRSRLQGVPARDVGRAWSVAYGVLRNRTLLEAHLAPLLRKPLRAQEPGARTALLLGACELLLIDAVPDRAAVDQAVETARALGAHRSTGFVNATLRRLAKGASTPSIPDREADPLGWAEIATSHPRWLLQRMAARVGPAEAASWAEVNNTEPPLFLRGATDIGEPSRVPGARRVVDRPAGGATSLPGWGEAAYWVQDEAAQAAGLFVHATPGQRILDACAAPGGKTFLLADQVGPEGRVDAVDRDAGRLDDLAAARKRLGFRQVTVDQRHWIKEPFGARAADEPYDAVLVDAPCSGLGVIRRHPDIRWGRIEKDLVGFAARQTKLLSALAPGVRPGGALVYAVCTFTREETDDVIDAFLASPRGQGFAAAPPRGLPPELLDGHVLRTFPHRHDTDGFFAVRLERTEA